MASSIGDGTPQLDDEVICEAERLQIAGVDGLCKVHRVRFPIAEVPDLFGASTLENVRFYEPIYLQKILFRTCVASSESLIPMNESSSEFMASIPSCVLSSN